MKDFVSVIGLMADVKRPAPSGPRTRRERAAATRRRMIAAATEVFVEHGYAGTRMTDIAQRAEVAVQTLYYSFSTKPDLLAACNEAAVLGPEGRPPLEQEFWSRARAAQTAHAAAAEFAGGITGILRRTAALWEASAAATHEPEVATFVVRSEELRREGYHGAVAFLEERFGLRSGLDRSRATDIVLVLGSAGTYLPFRRSGWTDEQYVEWLADTIVRLVLTD